MNKFRGDRRILEPGIQQLYDICHIPVTGVIPYTRLDIEDEDSLSERIDTSHKSVSTLKKQLDIVVIRLPHISNFTDFNALERMDIVNLRYVDNAAMIGSPDLIIIPGSKNTIGDLKWMRYNQIEAQIIRCLRQDVLVLGICGGYQMLGDVIDDSCNAETGETIPGMGLLPVVTTFSRSKHRTRVEGIICDQSGSNGVDLQEKYVVVYEIHMGESVVKTDVAFAKIRNTVDGLEYMDGCVCGNVAGTYMHGIFDVQEFCDSFIEMLCKRRGISQDSAHISYDMYKQAEYDKLADVIRANMDMDYIYRVIGL